MASLGHSGRHLTFPFQYVIMRNRMAMMSRACNPYNHLERWAKSALTGQERGCLPPVLERFSSLVKSLVVWRTVSGPGTVATGARKSPCMPKKTIQSRKWCYFKLPLVGLRYPDMPCYLGPDPRSCNGKLGAWDIPGRLHLYYHTSGKEADKASRRPMWIFLGALAIMSSALYT